MCLYSAKNITHEDDILVYKVLRVTKQSEKLSNVKEYCSPYHRDTTWHFRERKDIDASEPELVRHESVFFEEECFEIKGKAFHSFKDKEKALEEAYFIALMRDEPEDVYIVGEFIIPKDSRYVYEGLYYGSVSYASSSLIFQSFCDPISTL